MPRYAHHTDSHTFLGTHNEFDLYYCPAIEPMLNGACVAARYGNEDHECDSGLMALVENKPSNYPPAVVAAYNKAVSVGLNA